MFFQSTFSLLFRLGEFYCYAIKFTDSIPYHLHYSIEPSSDLFFPLIMCISPIVSIWFFSYNFYFYVEVF